MEKIEKGKRKGKGKERKDRKRKKERKRKLKKVKNRKVLLIKGLGSQSRTFLSLVYHILTIKP